MNRDYMANMLFNINDVVETLQVHTFNEEIREDYDESQFEEASKYREELVLQTWEDSLQ